MVKSVKKKSRAASGRTSAQSKSKAFTKRTRSKPTETLDQEQFITLLTSVGYTVVSAKKMWEASQEYVKLKKKLTQLEAQLVEMSSELKSTVQVPELRITFNNPAREYDYIKLCEDLGIEYKKLELVENWSPVARKAFIAESELDASRLSEQYFKVIPKKPSLKLRPVESGAV